MYEAESIILAIKKHPCLWNIHDKDYYNRDVKDLAWEQVYKEVINNWDTFTKVDKENKGADLKKKWTHIRDYFRRGLQKNKNASPDSATKNVKKYIYADLLYFLIPVFDKRNTEANDQSNDFDNNPQESSTETKKERSGSVEQLDDNTNSIEPPSRVLTPPESSVKRKKIDVPTQNQSMLHQNQQENNQKRQDIEDDDTKFLLSFRTHMKHMNENQKINFKLGMLQLLKKTKRKTTHILD